MEAAGSGPSQPSSPMEVTAETETRPKTISPPPAPRVADPVTGGVAPAAIVTEVRTMASQAVAGAASPLTGSTPVKTKGALKQYVQPSTVAAGSSGPSAVGTGVLVQPMWGTVSADAQASVEAVALGPLGPSLVPGAYQTQEQFLAQQRALAQQMAYAEQVQQQSLLEQAAASTVLTDQEVDQAARAAEALSLFQPPAPSSDDPNLETQVRQHIMGPVQMEAQGSSQQSFAAVASLPGDIPPVAEDLQSEITQVGAPFRPILGGTSATIDQIEELVRQIDPDKPTRVRETRERVLAVLATRKVDTFTKQDLAGAGFSNREIGKIRKSIESSNALVLSMKMAFLELCEIAKAWPETNSLRPMSDFQPNQVAKLILTMPSPDYLTPVLVEQKMVDIRYPRELDVFSPMVLANCALPARNREFVRFANSFDEIISDGVGLLIQNQRRRPWSVEGPTDAPQQTLQQRVEGKELAESDGVTYYKFSVYIPVKEAEEVDIARSEEMWKALLPGQIQCKGLYFDTKRALKYQKGILLVSQDRLQDFAQKGANRFAYYQMQEGYLLQGTQEKAMAAGFISKWDDLLLRYTNLYSDLRDKLDSLMRDAKTVQDHLEHDRPDDGTIEWPVEPTPLGECLLSPRVGFLHPDHLNQVAMVVDHTPPVPTEEYKKYLITQAADLCRCLRESDGRGDAPKEGDEYISGERLRNLLGIFVLAARKEAKRQGLSASDYLLGSVAFAQNVLKFLLTYLRIVPSPKANQPANPEYPKLVPVEWHVVLAMSQSLFERLPPHYFYLKDLVQHLAAISRAMRLPLNCVKEANRNEAVAALINVCGMTREQALYRVQQIVADQEACALQLRSRTRRDSQGSAASSRLGSERQSLKTAPSVFGSDLESTEASTPGMDYPATLQIGRGVSAQMGAPIPQYVAPAFDFGVPPGLVSTGVQQIAPGAASILSPPPTAMGLPQVALVTISQAVPTVALVGVPQGAPPGLSQVVIREAPSAIPGGAPVMVPQVIPGGQRGVPFTISAASQPDVPQAVVPTMPGMAWTAATAQQYPSITPATGVSYSPGVVATGAAPVVTVSMPLHAAALTSLDMPVRHPLPYQGPQVAMASSMTPTAPVVTPSSASAQARPQVVVVTTASAAQAPDFRYSPRPPRQ